MPRVAVMQHRQVIGLSPLWDLETVADLGATGHGVGG